VACYSAGGAVAAHPKGREMGIARNILVTPEGRNHPMFRGMPPVFSHLVTKAPSSWQATPGAGFRPWPSTTATASSGAPSTTPNTTSTKWHASSSPARTGWPGRLRRPPRGALGRSHPHRPEVATGDRRRHPVGRNPAEGLCQLAGRSGFAARSTRPVERCKYPQAMNLPFPASSG